MTQFYFLNADLGVWASLMTQMVKNPHAMQETCVPPLVGEGRSPGEGNGYTLQYSCLENSMDRGTWQGSPWGHKESDTK